MLNALKCATLRSHLRKYCISICDHKKLKLNAAQLGFLQYDVTVIGGGIVGTAIAREIKGHCKELSCLLLEKESSLGKHQSGHNSGVIHAGIYYKPGSLKAQFCKKGVELIKDYCNEKGIPYTTTGKLIVAANCSEVKVLEALLKRGVENDVDGLKMLFTKDELWRIEPTCKGVQALWSPKTGNVDWGCITKSFGEDYKTSGGHILLNNEVLRINLSDNYDYPILIKSDEGFKIKTKYLIICGGLQSNNLSKMLGKASDEKNTLVSFRVHYHQLDNHRLATNIYGIPNMNMPFLGIHLSPCVDGSVLLGPNAIPAYKLEGYREDEINFTYLKDTVNSKGFRNMMGRYFGTCVDQFKNTLCENFQIKQLQRLADIDESEIRPGQIAVQAQLINEDGSFYDDFWIEFFEGDGIKKRTINCRFMPSPAATCSISIAKYVANKFFEKYNE